MSFLLPCPVCGPRDVYEFRYGGEIMRRPLPDAGGEAWSAYRYLRTNSAGPAQEWWFHRAGCRRWFQAERDTASNSVSAAWWPGSRPSHQGGRASRADEVIAGEPDGG